MKLEKNAKPILCLRSLVLSYIITLISLLILSLLLYKFKLSSGQLSIGINLTYIISCLLSGFVIGRRAKVRRYLWGGLNGLLYFLVLFLVSFIFTNPLEGGILQIMPVLIICVGSGAAGGMVS